MKACPYCTEQIQDEAIKCRYCGEFLDGRPRPPQPAMAGYPPGYWGHEYRSEAQFLGLPLIHIAYGFDPQTGRPRIARSVIAIGNLAIGLIAIGLIAIGDVSAGGFAMGGLALGGLAVAGIGVGYAALGGMAVATYLAIGGAAISLQYAIGGLAIAPHTISPLGADPELLEIIQRWWPEAGELFREANR